MTALLVLLALAGGVVGFLLLSQLKITQGVGIIGLACLAGILARIAQADAQHKEVMLMLRTRPFSKKISPRTLKVCPYCRQPVPPEATVCPYCTREIIAEPESTTAP